MRNIERDNKYIRFYNEDDEMIIQALSDELCFYFDNYEEDEFVITRDDEILFNEIESLYNNVNETWDRQKKHYLPYIIQNGHIDVHSCYKEYNEANSF